MPQSNYVLCIYSVEAKKKKKRVFVTGTVHWQEKSTGFGIKAASSQSTNQVNAHWTTWQPCPPSLPVHACVLKNLGMLICIAARVFRWPVKASPNKGKSSERMPRPLITHDFVEQAAIWPKCFCFLLFLACEPSSRNAKLPSPQLTLLPAFLPSWTKNDAFSIRI